MGEPVPLAHLRPGKGWLRRLMRRLRTHAPVSVPVRVVRRRGVRLQTGEYVLGYMSRRQRWKCGKPLKADRFLIVFDSRLPAGEAWDCVVHEYAHCLDRDTRYLSPKDCHDARWGRCFAKAFKASLNSSPARRGTPQ